MEAYKNTCENISYGLLRQLNKKKSDLTTWGSVTDESNCSLGAADPNLVEGPQNVWMWF